MERRIHISQCMIVKDEEENMERALSWGKGIVSEQIVVDTGSTDHTVEIAEQMGAKVYHFKWEDDFAAAKNYAISKASGEWIAFLDADEYFSSEDAEKILSFTAEFQKANYDVILAKLVNLDEEGNIMTIGIQARLFRNISRLRYAKKIHERLVSVDGSEIRLADATGELSVYHTGYGLVKNREKKTDRNQRLIKAELAENPDNWEMLSYLGDVYHMKEELDEAVEAYRKSVSLMPEDGMKHDPGRIASTYTKLLEILYVKPDTEQSAFMEIYNKAVKQLHGNADPDYYAGLYFVRHGDYHKAEHHMKRVLKLLEEYGSNGRSGISSANIRQVYEMLALCCGNNGKLTECVHYCTVLLNENKYLMDSLFLMLHAFRCDELSGQADAVQADAVIAFLGRTLYDLNTLQDRYFILKAAGKAGYDNLALKIRKLFTSEELALVDRAGGRTE